MALKFSLNLAMSAGCNRLAVNSDNQELLEIMNKDGQYARDAAAIVDDCYHLACELSSIVFEFFSRESNAAAHELASIAGVLLCNDLVDNAPSELLPLLLKDVSLLTTEQSGSCQK